MAREIDLNQELSEDDVKYLVDRCRWEDIRTNFRNLGYDEPKLPSARAIRAQAPRTGVHARKREDALTAIQEALGNAAPAIQENEENPQKTDYNKLTVPQLKEELVKRQNEYREAGDAEAAADLEFTNDDRKDDLVSLLESDDEESGEESD